MKTSSKGNGTIGLQLNKLNDVSVVDVRGRKCVVIPVEENGIYISEKGTIVLSFYMTKMNEEKWGKTHALKRRLNREEYLSMTKAQRDSTPIVGYFEPYRSKEDDSSYALEQPKRYNNSNDDLNGLPF